MTLERPGRKPHKINIDPGDLSKAYAAMEEGLAKHPASTADTFDIDSRIHKEQECTPSQEVARKDFDRIKKSLEKLGLDISRVRFLEVGSGMGELLAVLLAEGVDAVGVDYNPREYRGSTNGLPIIQAPLEAVNPSISGTFTVIFAKNVFDNDRYKFQNYQKMLAHIDTLLEKDGVFIKLGTGTFTQKDIPPAWESPSGAQDPWYQVYRKIT